MQFMHCNDNRLGCSKRKRPAEELTLLPPSKTFQPHAEPSEQTMAAAATFGLATPANACHFWKREGRSLVADGEMSASDLDFPSTLHKMMGAISAARLAAASADAAYSVAAVAAVKQCNSKVEAVTRSQTASLDKAARKAAVQLVTAIAGHLSVGETWLQSIDDEGKLSREAVPHVVAALDGCYYALLEHFLTCGWAAPVVPPPHDYLPAAIGAHPGNATACEALLEGLAAREGKRLLLEAWDVEEAEDGRLVLPQEVAEGNPLLAVMWARFQEGCRFFEGMETSGEVGYGGRGQNDAKGTHQLAHWPASDALRAWRASAREVHVYAYAAPNAAAVEALVARSPLLEVGAGTGYWARALRQRGADILALDACPPSPTAATANTYHGRIPAVSEVQAGGIKAAGRLPKRTLFLCYPPPGDTMAVSCLAKYRGRCVCVVGEWQGDTATPEFTRALLDGWNLVQRVALPQWSDCAHELTIWERRRQHTGSLHAGAASDASNGSSHSPDAEGVCSNAVSLPLASCAACGKPGTTSASQQQQQHGLEGAPEQQNPGAVSLRRCRHCRNVAYCSVGCRRKHGKRHAERHAMRLLLGGRKLRFDGDADFEPLLL